MSAAQFHARLDRFVTYIAVSASNNDVRNVYASIFAGKSYPWKSSRCFFKNGWHGPSNRDDHFLRKWNDGDVDWSDRVDEREARRIVSSWGFELDPGLRLLAYSAWVPMYRASATLENAQAFIEAYGFPVTAQELLGESGRVAALWGE